MFVDMTLVDILVHVLLLLVVLLLSVHLLLVIPTSFGVFLGQKAGLWSTKNRLGKTKGEHAFPLPYDAKNFFWWGIFAVFLTVETIIMILGDLDIPNIPILPQTLFFPFYIYRALLIQQLEEPVYVMVYSILMMTGVFAVGFVRALLFTRKKELKADSIALTED